MSAAHAAPVDGVPVVEWPVLQECLAGEDLVVMLGPVSEPVRALSAGRPDVAGRLLEPWRSSPDRDCGWRHCGWAGRAPAPATPAPVFDGTSGD
ncbi:hypothetical protein ACFWNF_17075 [Streptomyces anulatus]|uniref:hypothetical protein n=1 Tax=Streptomyces anulatus TaxID=1892 RepID=UPI00364E2AE2